MAPKVLDWEKIVPEKHFRFAPPKSGATHGGFSVGVDVFDEDSNANQRFVHQAPPLSLPFGISSKTNKNTPDGATHYSASFSFPTVRMDPVSGEFHGEPTTLAYLKFLQSVEALNKKKAFEQSKTWFKKPMSESIINEFYFNAVYISEKVRSGEYSPTFTAKITEEPNRWATKFFVCRETPGEPTTVAPSSMDLVPKSRKVIPLIETSGIWFAGKQFGMSFKVVQMAYFEDDNFTGMSIDLGSAVEYTTIERPLLKNTEDNEAVTGTKRKFDEGIMPPGKAAAFNFPTESAKE